MLAVLAPQTIDPETLLAVDDAGQTMRYGELQSAKDDWAKAVPGRRLVALLCANTVPMLRAYIGLQAAGHVVVLLSSKIADAALKDLILRYNIEAIVRPDAPVELLAEPSGNLHPELSVCLSTSGSTGSPKLVRFSNEKLAANAQSIAEYLSLTEIERPLAHLPFEYSFGLSVLHSHMAVGATLLLTQHTIMQKPFWQRFSEATSFAGVPFHFEMLLRMRLARADLPKLTSLTQAGGRISQKDAETLHQMATDKGWKFHIMYGQTEAGPRISWLPHSRMAGHLDSIGQAIPGVSIDLKSDGEMVVKSPAVMMGYAQERIDLALGDELHGELHTGDLAERFDGDLYRITGRKSRFIKLQGNRVSLEDVEARLTAAGHTVYASGVDDRLVLFTQEVDVEAIQKVAVDLFSFPARSLNVCYLETLLRRSNDKIDYGALLRLAKQEN